MVLRGEITKEKLTNIYDTVNRIINKKDCYYSDEELKKIKKATKNIILKM